MNGAATALDNLTISKQQQRQTASVNDCAMKFAFLCFLLCLSGSHSRYLRANESSDKTPFKGVRSGLAKLTSGFQDKAVDEKEKFVVNTCAILKKGIEALLAQKGLQLEDVVEDCDLLDSVVRVCSKEDEKVLMTTLSDIGNDDNSTADVEGIQGELASLGPRPSPEPLAPSLAPTVTEGMDLDYYEPGFPDEEGIEGELASLGPKPSLEPLAPSLPPALAPANDFYPPGEKDQDYYAPGFPDEGGIGSELASLGPKPSSEPLAPSFPPALAPATDYHPPGEEDQDYYAPGFPDEEGIEAELASLGPKPSSEPLAPSLPPALAPANDFYPPGEEDQDYYVPGFPDEEGIEGELASLGPKPTSEPLAPSLPPALAPANDFYPPGEEDQDYYAPGFPDEGGELASLGPKPSSEPLAPSLPPALAPANDFYPPGEEDQDYYVPGFPDEEGIEGELASLGPKPTSEPLAPSLPPALAPANDFYPPGEEDQDYYAPGFPDEGGELASLGPKPSSEPLAPSLPPALAPANDFYPPGEEDQDYYVPGFPDEEGIEGELASLGPKPTSEPLAPSLPPALAPANDFYPPGEEDQDYYAPGFPDEGGELASLGPKPSSEPVAPSLPPALAPANDFYPPGEEDQDNYVPGFPDEEGIEGELASLGPKPSSEPLAPSLPPALAPANDFYPPGEKDQDYYAPGSPDEAGDLASLGPKPSSEPLAPSLPPALAPANDFYPPSEEDQDYDTPGFPDEEGIEGELATLGPKPTSEPLAPSLPPALAPANDFYPPGEEDQDYYAPGFPDEEGIEGELASLGPKPSSEPLAPSLPPALAPANDYYPPGEEDQEYFPPGFPDDEGIEGELTSLGPKPSSEPLAPSLPPVLAPATDYYPPGEEDQEYYAPGEPDEDEEDDEDSGDADDETSDPPCVYLGKVVTGLLKYCKENPGIQLFQIIDMDDLKEIKNKAKQCATDVRDDVKELMSNFGVESSSDLMD